MAKNEIEIVISAKDNASKVFSGVGSSLSRMGEIAGGILTAGVITKVAEGILGLASGAVQLAKDAMPLEGIKTAFEEYANSVEGGSKTVIASMRKASSQMIKDTDLMLSYNKATQLVSNSFANDLPDAVKYLTKVAAATGQDVNYLLDSYVTGIGRLSPMILDNLGIQVDLTAAYQDYADSIGTTVESLSKEEQQIAVNNAALIALEKNTAALPEVNGTAAQSFAALKANMSNLREEIGLKLLPVFSTASEKLLEAFQSEEVQTAINEKLIPAIERIVGDEESGIVGLITKLSSGDLQGAFAAVFGVETTNKIIGFQNEVARIFGVINNLVTYEVPRWFRDMRGAIYSELVQTSLKIWMFANKANEMLATVNAVIGTISGKPFVVNPVTIPYPAFASGGSFIVPGSGSGDRPFTMGLEPGEQVTVTPRNRVTATGAAGAGLNLTVNITSAVNLADRNYAERELMPFIEAGVRQLMARGAA